MREVRRKCGEVVPIIIPLIQAIQVEETGILVQSGKISFSYGLGWTDHALGCWTCFLYTCWSSFGYLPLRTICQDLLPAFSGLFLLIKVFKFFTYSGC